MSEVNGKSIITLAKDLGLTNICNCFGATKVEKKEEEKKEKGKCPKCGKTECRETWGIHTNSRILKLHPNIQCVSRRFINEVEDTYKMQIRITDAYRSYVEQDELYQQGAY